MAAVLRWLLVAGLAVACTGGSRPSPADRERLARYVLDAPPADVGQRLDADFDGKVVLLGCRVVPGRVVAPGQKVRLTLFWQVIAPVGKGYGLFTHVLDGTGARLQNLDNVGPLRQWKGRRQVLGPWAWEPGKTYVDEQEFAVPLGPTSTRLQVVGGIWKGAERLPIRRGRQDREGRALIADLTTEDSAELPPSTRVPVLRVERLEHGLFPRIDGRLDEPVWAGAASTGPFRNVATGAPNHRDDLGGTARVLWDDHALYVGVTITDRNLEGGFPASAVDPHLWTRDAAELMIDPDGDGDGRDYYEIQVGPQNLVFDSLFDEYNAPRGGPRGPFGHQDWSSRVESAVTVLGTLDWGRDRDEGYVIEARLPWAVFDRARRVPPAPGDEWRMNFYAMQHDDGVAWSPILGQGNFHKASRFGRVLFVERGQVAPPGSSPIPAGSSPAAPPSAAAAAPIPAPIQSR